MSFEVFKARTKEIEDNYVIVTYDLESSEAVHKAAWDIALGQSVGNPNVRNHWETDELLKNHCAIIIDDPARLHEKKAAIVDIGFPIVNTDWDNDGISQLLCQIMGGQVDIDHITKCRAISILIPDAVKKHFLAPKFGFSGIRQLTGQYNKPLFGGIIKPKTGLNPHQLLEMVKQLVDGGVDFIKEDEILANPDVCSLINRVPLISNYLNAQSRKIVYCFCINGDPHTLTNRARFVAQEGGNGVHINIWSGLGAYNSIRKLDLPLHIHYQKSGDKVITHPNNAFGISWEVLCHLAALSGVDTIHTGMFGGYLNDDETTLRRIMGKLVESNVVPALSCGMTPELVVKVTSALGNDYMANVGGAIHGHPGGSEAGAIAMRNAIDGIKKSQPIKEHSEMVLNPSALENANKDVECDDNYATIGRVYTRMDTGPEGSTNFSQNNRKWLAEYMKKIPLKCIVEIGVENNVDRALTSTRVILDNKDDSTYYFGIDLEDKHHLDNPDKNIYTIQTNATNVTEVMDFIRSKGIDKIDLFFIDGWHSIAQCQIEFDGYSPFVSDNGIVGFHDTNHHFGPAWLLNYIDKTKWDVENYPGDPTCDFGIGFAHKKK